MSKRLEVQLEELQVELTLKKAELATAEREHGAAIKAAEAKLEAAEAATAKASDERDALAEKISTEHKIQVYSRRKSRIDPEEDVVETQWHPDFLKRVAGLIGVPYSARSTVDPKNQSTSLYEEALQMLEIRLINEHPDVLKLTKRYNTAAKLSSDVRDVLYDVRRHVFNAQSAVRRVENQIREVELKIRTRDSSKGAFASNPTAAEAESELAKSARAKLRAILDRKLTIPLEEP